MLEALDARTVSTTTGTATDGTSGTAVDGTASDGGGDTSAGTTGESGSTGGGSTGAGGTVAAGSSSCGAPGATDAGVTDKEIKVASIVTDSGPLPGATEGAYRGAVAYASLINANGGICGRKITVLKGDDGLDPPKGRGEFLRLEPQVLAFVGNFSVADSGYIDLIGKTGVPFIALTVDPAGRKFPNVYPKTTDNLVGTGAFTYWLRQHPNAKRAGVMFADVGGVRSNMPGHPGRHPEGRFHLRQGVGPWCGHSGLHSRDP